MAEFLRDKTRQENFNKLTSTSRFILFFVWFADFVLIQAIVDQLELGQLSKFIIGAALAVLTIVPIDNWLVKNLSKRREN